MMGPKHLLGTGAPKNRVKWYRISRLDMMEVTLGFLLGGLCLAGLAGDFPASLDPGTDTFLPLLVVVVVIMGGTIPNLKSFPSSSFSSASRLSSVERFWGWS